MIYLVRMEITCKIKYPQDENESVRKDPLLRLRW